MPIEGTSKKVNKIQIMKQEIAASNNAVKFLTIKLQKYLYIVKYDKLLEPVSLNVMKKCIKFLNLFSAALNGTRE